MDIFGKMTERLGSMGLRKPVLLGSGAGAWRYIVVASLPLCFNLWTTVSMQMQLQQMRDQIMNPQMMQMQSPMNGPQLSVPSVNMSTADPALMQNGFVPDGLSVVDLPIENISQETQVWCWAAVAQQLIAASRGMEQTPQQCALVATANNAPADYCCAQQNAQCVTTGSLAQVQGLVQQFGGRTSAYAEPTDAMTLYRTLQQGHAVVIGIDAGQGMGHVVVARGMSFQRTPQGTIAMVHINDPMARFTQPVPFSQIARVWRSAIIIN